MLGGESGYSYGEHIRGVVRFVQAGDECIIDGTVDGLTPGSHGIHVHECGDISNGCDRYEWISSLDSSFQSLRRYSIH